LYCEGGSKSPDIRVISVLLAGVCVVAPSGGKYGFGQRVRLARELQPSPLIAGLCDRDFDADITAPRESPREWQIDNGKTWLGWRWERKELENYLIDPGVVERALGGAMLDMEMYRAALQHAADTIAVYTAARVALSLNRPRFAPLDNAWGPPRNLDAHPFPDALEEADCRTGIQTILRDYAQTHSPVPQNVAEQFDSQLLLCRPGGVRHQHFLTFFAGKDLLLAMETALAQFGFSSPRQFRERIIKRIAESTENVWTWLPEWTLLRKMITT
jgi:hypothetical protein